MQFTAKFTTRKADQDTNNMYTLLVYLGMFSWLYTLLVSWYVFLVVHFVVYFGTFSWLYTLLVSWYLHFVGILVPTLCWYLGMFSWLYTLCGYFGILVTFPGCTLSWYLGSYVILVVNLAANLHTVSSVQ